MKKGEPGWTDGRGVYRLLEWGETLGGAGGSDIGIFLRVQNDARRDKVFGGTSSSTSLAFPFPLESDILKLRKVDAFKDSPLVLRRSPLDPSRVSEAALSL